MDGCEGHAGSRPVTPPIAFVAVMIVGFGCATGSLARAESLSDLLEHRTQELSDAGHNGNKAVLERYLDPDVVYVNEDGSMVGKAQVIDGASSPPAGIAMSIKVTDWALRRHGNTAVATFVDVLNENFYGQALQYQYRSTEVWQLKRHEWRMISSQTLTLPVDPPTMQLPPKVLEDYVGSYRLTPKSVLKITLQGDRLFSSIDDGTAVEIKPEVRDMLFTPGRPGRKVFQRDDHGRVIGYHIRLDGRDIAVSKLP